jgi:hypothetical protein
MMPTMAWHLAMGAAGPALGWWVLRRVAGTPWRGAICDRVTDLAPAALLWALLVAAMARPLAAGAVVLGLCLALAVADVVAPERSGRSGCQDGTDELPGRTVGQGAMGMDLVVVGEPGGQ